MKNIIALFLICLLLLSGCSTTRVTINTNVPDARVIVDGELLGNTPVQSVKMKNKT